MAVAVRLQRGQPDAGLRRHLVLHGHRRRPGYGLAGGGLRRLGAGRRAPASLGFKNTGAGHHDPGDQRADDLLLPHHVDVADASTITSATLNAVLDDGAVVYVNGVEAGRGNLAAGTWASPRRHCRRDRGAAENTPITVTLPTRVFHTGTNTIAVEVHNKANAPGDLGFDAELKFNTGGGGGARARVGGHVDRRARTLVRSAVAALRVPSAMMG